MGALAEWWRSAERLDSRGFWCAVHGVIIWAQPIKTWSARARQGSPSECPVVVMLPTSSPYAASSFRTATCTWPCAQSGYLSLTLAGVTTDLISDSNKHCG